MVSHAVIVSSPVAATAAPPLATIAKLTLTQSSQITPPPALRRLFALGEKREDDDDLFAERYAHLLQVAARAAFNRNRRAAAELAGIRKANAAMRVAKIEDKTRRMCGADIAPGNTAPAPAPAFSS